MLSVEKFLVAWWHASHCKMFTLVLEQQIWVVLMYTLSLTIQSTDNLRYYLLKCLRIPDV